MAELTDEDLMRLADRQLSLAERERMLNDLAQDPAARARLAVYEATGHVLAEPFLAIANAPVPQHLVDLVVGKARGAAGGRGAPPRRSVLGGILDRIFSVAEPWRTPAFASALILVGAGAGWLLYAAVHARTMQDSLVLAGGRIQAQGVLFRALETGGSGQTVAAIDSRELPATAQPRLTFKSKANEYCRQYLLDVPGEGRFAGIGCRQSDGRWMVRYHASIPASASAQNKSVPANDPLAALGGVVDLMMAGDPFGQEEEALALSRRWRD